MNIKRLPKYLINKLKAGEIVERPASVVKELMENSLDAGATNIYLEIKDGGRQLIKIQDDGIGVALQDLDLVLERYATSKIQNENDLYNISSYGFRGEALASIAEVSKFTFQTKTTDDEAGNQIVRISQDMKISQIPFDKKTGTNVFVQDIFFNTPARQKFLKSANTERNYIKDVFLDFAMVNHNINFKLIHNDKLIYDLKATDDVLSRITNIYKAEWKDNFKIIDKKDEQKRLYGIISDVSLTFPGPDNMKIFVNRRPVIDKIMRKAILTAYQRQIPSNEYPLAVMFIEISPDAVDVNVHPRKLEVKFIDPGSMFNFVKMAVQSAFGEDRISTVKMSDFGQKVSNNSNYIYTKTNQDTTQEGLEFVSRQEREIFSPKEQSRISLGNYKLIGQIWQKYIILEDDEHIYLIDQHALAERIAYEKMKSKIGQDTKTEPLLDPVTVSTSANIDLQEKINQLNNIGFDVGLFGQNKVIIHGMPKVLVQYNVDISKVMDKLLAMGEISLEAILDNILATKACKISIKAGQKLSYEEMKALVQEGLDIIRGMFSCQHGRPSFVRLSKQDVDGFFDR